MKPYKLLDTDGQLVINPSELSGIEDAREGRCKVLLPYGHLYLDEPYLAVLNDVTAALRALDDLS